MDPVGRGDDAEPVTVSVHRGSQPGEEVREHFAAAVAAPVAHRTGDIDQRKDIDRRPLLVQAHVPVFEGIGQTRAKIQPARIRVARQRGKVTKGMALSAAAAAVRTRPAPGCSSGHAVHEFGGFHGAATDLRMRPTSSGTSSARRYS